ncbi:transporter [Flavobacterium chungbukense]|uniref:Uncharacterized protein n=1 Tax=Flavobacterium chungbukense TaxID=877464 RepID=A0ABP7YE79_9FLAO|nr:transporter [Flavobacterium chungbukense]MCC4920568.1 transporter [Flavobacterium chungbukense]
MISSQQIQTDRPNETEGPSAVSKQMLQVESGFSFEEKDSEKRMEFPKLHFVKNAELRLERAPQTTNEPDNPTYGFKPLSFGFKYHLADHDNTVPDAALIGRISIPWLADNLYQEPKCGPEVRLLFENELSKSSHIGYIPGIRWTAESVRPEYLHTLCRSFAL